MAQKHDRNTALEAFETDPRIRSLPLSTRLVWLYLIRAMQSLPGLVLRFGHEVPNARRIAMMIGISESELEANLEPILSCGLLELEPDGALASPLLKGAVARSETNRINGLRGGAVRKAQAEQRRLQRELVLPIAGGLADADPGGESEPKAKPAGSPDAAKLSLEASSSSVAKLAVVDADFHRVGRTVLELMNVDPAKSMVHYGLARQWLANGWTEAVILATVRAKMRPGIKHLGYFTEAIRDAMAREVPADAGSPSSRFVAWEQAVGAWRAAGKVKAMPLLEEFAADGSRMAA